MNVSKSIDNRQNLDWSLTCVNGTTNEITEKKNKRIHDPRDNVKKREEKPSREIRELRQRPNGRFSFHVSSRWTSRFFRCAFGMPRVYIWPISEISIEERGGHVAAAKTSGSLSKLSSCSCYLPPTPTCSLRFVLRTLRFGFSFVFSICRYVVMVVKCVRFISLWLCDCAIFFPTYYFFGLPVYLCLHMESWKGVDEMRILHFNWWVCTRVIFFVIDKILLNMLYFFIKVIYLRM